MAKNKRSTAAKAIPNLSANRRFEMARRAAFEIDYLSDLMRVPIAQMVMAETMEQEVALNAYLERMKRVADALIQVSFPEEDRHHDAVELKRVLNLTTGTGVLG